MATLDQKIESAREEVINDGLNAIQSRFYVERISAFDAQENHIYTINAITGEKTFFAEMPPLVDTKYYDMNTDAFGHWAG